MGNKLWETRHRAFQETIKEVRENSGLTQKALAVKMGKYQSYVSKYESGERRLDYIELLEILDNCEMNISTFHRLYMRKL